MSRIDSLSPPRGLLSGEMRSLRCHGRRESGIKPGVVDILPPKSVTRFTVSERVLRVGGCRRDVALSGSVQLLRGEDGVIVPEPMRPEVAVFTDWALILCRHCCDLST